MKPDEIKFYKQIQTLLEKTYEVNIQASEIRKTLKTAEENGFSSDRYKQYVELKLIELKALNDDYKEAIDILLKASGVDTDTMKEFS